MTPSPEPTPGPPPPRRSANGRRAVVGALLGLIQLVLVVGLIGGGVFAAHWFNSTKPATASSRGDREEVARPVEIDLARVESRSVVVRAMGTVTPAREAVIRPRVAGMIVEQSPSFVPGGFFSAGAFMAQLDRADYEQTLAQRESDLARAEAALQIELGDQAVAREELELLEVDIPEINRDMILRVPQVNRARAEVRSAEAAIERAHLDLERTRLVAPFDGQLVQRNAVIGNNVSQGENLATLVGIDQYWIELAVPVSSLRWIETTDDTGAAGSRTTIRFPAAWGDDATRTGEVARRIGRLERGSRLARVIVAVDDPLARAREHAGEPSLILGAFVDAEILGRTIDRVVVIDRDLVRESEAGGDVVWVMGADDRLVISPVEVVYRGPDVAYVVAGLEHGDRMVRTNLTTPVAGMLLRMAGDPEPDRGDLAQGAGAGG